jgi:predicted esterase
MARNRNAMHIWFNNSSFDDPFEREELQIQGLAENFQYISQLILIEAQALTLRKVFLGGLSQGCAMTLHMLLGFDADGYDSDIRLGRFIGMSGWLPFQGAVNDLLSTGAGEGEDITENPFASDNKVNIDLEDDLGTKVARFIRKNIMDASTCNKELLVYRRIPIFLGHGDQDDIVELDYGNNAMVALRSLGLGISWKVYEQQGHWYKVPDTIDDIAEFLENNT